VTETKPIPGIVNPADEQPKWMIHRCTIPDVDGKPCGAWKKYRILPKDTSDIPTDPAAFRDLMTKRVGATYKDWFQTHLRVVHPHEQESLLTEIVRAEQYFLLKRLKPLMVSERE
jgi:hypothetical protein